MNRARSAALILSALAGGAVLSAFQQRPVFRSGTETVQVDVVVRDRSGLPVHGLKAEDFVVLDRGKPQQVVAFQAVQQEAHETPSFSSHFPITTTLDVSSNQTAQAKRLIVLVLDDLHGYRGRDDTVKKIARQVVEALGTDTFMALLTTSGNYNVEITDDRGRLIAGVEHFKGARAVRRPMLAVETRAPAEGGQPPGRGQQATVARDPGADLQEFDANLRMYGTLEQAARLFNAADGRRKAFVLVSENLAKDVTGALTSQQAAGDIVSGGEEYVAGNLEAKPRVTMSYYDRAILDMMTSMRKANVVTYAVDPRGAVSAQDVLLECFGGTGWGVDSCAGDEANRPTSMSSWVRIAQDGLTKLAEATGGFAIVNSSDFAAGVARIADDLDNYYLLGFNTDDARTQGYRKLEVRVPNRRDVQLRYRRGYEIGAKEKEKTEPAKNALFGLASGVLPAANIPLRLNAAALPGTSRDARVHVVLEVSAPRVRLEERDAWLRDQLQYGVTVVDMKGAKIKDATGYTANLVFRPSATGGTPPEVVRYQVGLDLNLPPGRYQLRAAASSAKLKEGGSVYLPIDVPDFSKEPIGLSTLLIGYGSGPRIPSVVGSTPAARGLPGRISGPAAFGRAAVAPPPPPTPIQLALPLTPTLDREFQTTDDVVLYFEVARRDRARDIALGLMVIDRDDRVLQQYGQKLQVGSAGKVSVRIPLRDLGPGAFRLRVHGSDGVNETTSEVAIVIR